MGNFNFLVKGIFIGIEMGLSDICHFLKRFEVWIFSMCEESNSLWIEYTSDNLGFQESAYITVIKTIPIIDIIVSFCANFICDNYLLYLLNSK